MRGEGASTGAIERIYRERFRAFVLSMTAFLGDGEEALDAVQDGFALALRRRGSFHGDGSLEGWLWRIVLNVARDRRRSGRRQYAVEPDNREFRVESSERNDHLRVALLALPERQRLAVFLRYYGGLSYPQIAEALDVAPGTIAASLHAAHRTLRHELEEVRN